MEAIRGGLIRKWKIPTVNAVDAGRGFYTFGQFPFIYWTQREGAGELIFDWLKSGTGEDHLRSNIFILLIMKLFMGRKQL